MINDIDSEYRLLASFVDEPDYILRVNDQLFTDDRKQLYRAMRDCFMQYGEIVVEGVERFYGRSVPQQIDVARGAKSAPIIDKLATLASKRQILSMQIALERLLGQQEINLEDVRQITNFKPIIASQDTTLANGVLEFVSDLNRKRSGQYQFIETGLPFLDFMLGGEWPRQALTVILGQAGGGKTALVCNSMLRMAKLPNPIASLFISLEMTKPRLISRLVANLKRIDGIKLRKGDINTDELRQVETAIAEIQTLPIFIDDRPGLSITDIVSQMREHKERHNVQAVFIDYLQIIGHDQSENQSEILGSMTQAIRNTAVELDIAAVLLSQQNRVQQGLQSILGSGRVGHIADCVFEIKMDIDSASDDYRLASFDFVKNREGPLGQQSAPYLPKYLAFEA